MRTFQLLDGRYQNFLLYFLYNMVKILLKYLFIWSHFLGSESSEDFGASFRFFENL